MPSRLPLIIAAAIALGAQVSFARPIVLNPTWEFFEPDDITGMGVGGNSRAGEADNPGAPLANPGFVHAFRLRVERVSETELSYSLRWENNGNISIHSFSAYDETTGIIDGEPDPADVDVHAKLIDTGRSAFGHHPSQSEGGKDGFPTNLSTRMSGISLSS
jgi:hypothetical protein